MFDFSQTNKAEAKVDQRAAAHNHHIAGQRGIQRVNPQRRRGIMHGSGGVHRKGHPGRKNAAHHRQHQPFFQIEVFGFNAHLAFFQLAGAGDYRHANHRNQHAEQRHLATLGMQQHIDLPVDNRGHQRTDNQGDPDGNTDPHRHAEVAHGQAVVNIADPPHRAKQKHRQ